MKSLLRISVFFFSISIHAQDKGMLMIAVSPSSGTIVRLDTTRIQLQSVPFDWSTGTYVLKAWAPKRELLIDTVKVEEQKLTFYKAKLKYSDKYIDYRKQIFRHRMNQTAPTAILAVYSAISLCLYNNNIVKQEAALKNAMSEKEKYEGAFVVSKIESSKYNYEVFKKEYNRYHKRNTIITATSCVVVPVGIAAIVWFWMKEKQKGKPVYEEQSLLSFYESGKKMSLHFTASGIALKY